VLVTFGNAVALQASRQSSKSSESIGHAVVVVVEVVMHRLTKKGPNLSKHVGIQSRVPLLVFVTFGHPARQYSIAFVVFESSDTNSSVEELLPFSARHDDTHES